MARFFSILCALIGLPLVCAFTPAGKSFIRTLGTTVQGFDSGTLYGVVNTNPNGGAILGQVGPSQVSAASGAGVYGVFNSSSGAGEGVLGVGVNGNGIVAEQFGGYYSALFAENYSAFAGPAIYGIANGNAVVGVSQGTSSIVGITQNNSSTASAPSAGVLGEDNSNSAYNSGVVGQSTNGSFGVLGQALTANVLSGVAGYARGTIGVVGSSDNYVAVYAQNASTSAPQLAIQARAGNGSSGQPMIVATNANSNDVMSLDQAGNLIVSGALMQYATPLSSRRGAASTSSVATYTPQQTERTEEDFGEAKLVNGRASVQLDGRFARIIRRDGKYLIFLTPLGPSHNLYVASRSASGFEVREDDAGRSSIAFDYRIVAKPISIDAPRLPALRLTTRLGAEHKGALPPMSEPRDTYRRLPTNSSRTRRLIP